MEFAAIEELVNPKHSAIIVIDMQNDFCSPKGIAVKGANLSSIKQVGKQLGDFLTEARKSDIKIFHTLYTTVSEWTNSPVWSRIFKDFPSICKRGTWGADWFEEVEALRPQPTDYVIEKHRYSAFVGTDLDLVLKSLGVRTVIVTGTATNVCVESTVRDAVMHEYHVVVPEDCVGSTFSDLHKATLENIKMFFGTVTTSKLLLQVWSGMGSRS